MSTNFETSADEREMRRDGNRIKMSSGATRLVYKPKLKNRVSNVKRVIYRRLQE